MRTFIYRAKALCLCVRLTSVLALIFSSFFFDSAAFGQHGAQTAPVALDQLVQSAETILRGHVVSAAMEPHPQFANLQTVVVTISVAKVLKGEAPATFSFRQFVWDARDISDNASYRKAGELLLFLNPVSPYGLTSPVGLDQGRFRVLRNAKGKAFAQNGRANFGLFNQVATRATSRGIALSREAQTMMAKPAGQASLDALEDAIGSLVSAKK
jgi:hypothetical protein